jgi:hypothetical protein
LIDQHNPYIDQFPEKRDKKNSHPRKGVGVLIYPVDRLDLRFGRFDRKEKNKKP